MNKWVTSAHVILILSYSIVICIFEAYGAKSLKASAETVNLGISLFIFSGALDIFLACMMWFILDPDFNPKYIRHESYNVTYPVLDVIRKRAESELDDDKIEI